MTSSNNKSNHHNAEQVVVAMWQKDILQSESTLQDYCAAVAKRYFEMFGETIEPTAIGVYTALKSKGIL